MTAIYGCGFAVLEMTFIFVMLLLLHGLRKIIGNAGFYLSLGLLFAFMQLSGVAGISINTNFPGLDFNLSNTVLLLPFLAALIVVYIADGTLEAQRLIIALLAVVFISGFYASDGMFAVVDIFLGICGVINCLVMFRLAGRAIEAYRDYRAQKAAGKETPVFSKDALSDSTGVIEWE